MALPSDIPLQDAAFYNLALLPDWKLEMWQKISMAARVNDAFSHREYNEDGMIMPHLPKFQRLFRTMVR